ncbi:FtsX-like permease family protein [Chitinophaga sp. LS1]|uniref:FtsX-like permease family protein n=1 Tax=Chitinophaga sp. LS1 TaxID=3051176 RepID=UPI002AAAC223|nr:ABC transporter permease [Chitinophaga sp. LS1]WPV64856.1 ABC transporter permease [Chitinophaga sp. LS1]
MLKNYLKIALRNLWKHKGFSAITIFGLAIGLATCLLITLFVTDELSYDKFNANADRIYRLDADFLINGTIFHERSTPAAFGPSLKRDFPQIEEFVRFDNQGKALVKKAEGEETLIEENTSFADPGVFKIFSLPFIVGDPATALSQPNTLVISERMARKYFQSTDVLGKTLKMDNTTFYTITGVIRNTPTQSHLHFDIIRSMGHRTDDMMDRWLSNSYTTYILAKPGVSASRIQQIINEGTKRYMEPGLMSYLGENFAQLEKHGGYFRYNAIALKDIHLRSTNNDEAEPGGNITYVYIFIITGVLILLIACVNFMNLSTARSAGRAREVGVRKVLGSEKRHLVFQFISESVLTAFFALLIAVIIAAALLPYLNNLSDKSISLHWTHLTWIMPGLIVTCLVVGLLAGSYPAFFLSSFEPVQVLKGKYSKGMKGSWLRNGLVVFQFTATILMLVGTLVIFKQLQFIRNSNTGYNREQVLVLQNIGALWNHAKSFQQEVKQIPGVVNATITSSLPTSEFRNTNSYSKTPMAGDGKLMALVEWMVDADYIPTMDMQVVGGRNFSPQMASDTNAVLLNETAAKVLGYEDLKDRYLYNEGQFHVIGIVKDFNAGTMKSKIPPLIFRLGEYRQYMAVRIKSNDLTGVVAQIKDKYQNQQDMSGQPFRYTFMDDDFDHMYKAEERTGQVFTIFAVLAIIIAAMGVFGLVTYAAEQRAKEIGIRKVLGASISGIVTLLSKEFLRLVIVAILIATPLSYVLMNRWLQDFSYRTNIGWMVFVIAALVAIGITLLTISFRVIKAALANPVHSLKAE